MKATLKRLARKLLKRRRATSPDLPDPAQRGHKRTHLFEVRRRVSIYQRALWGCDFTIRPMSREAEIRPGHQLYIENQSIHLPSVYHDYTLNNFTRVTGLEIFRAASAHAAAHLVYSKSVFSHNSLSKWQKAVIATIEDARVETLSIRRFPGLKSLWSKQHMANPLYQTTARDYLNRLARALLDETYLDSDPWICQGRALFKAASELETNQISSDIGMTLAQSFLEKKLKFKPKENKLGALYRDDNRCLWASTKADEEEEEPPPISPFMHKGLFYASNAVKDDNFKDSNPPKAKKEESRYVVSEPFIYPDWNYRNQTETPSWVTLREMSSQSGNLQIVENIITQNIDLISRMKVVLDAMRLGGMCRIKKMEVGDEIDINAAIRALIDIRQGIQPDLRIMTRTAQKGRDVSVMVLLDLSKSSNELVRGQSYTVLQLSQQICVLLADAINKVGDPFAIHGFCSRTRNFVEYFRIKDFDQAYDDVPKAKIAGMTGQNSTRMGSAIRHATYHLNQQATGKKLLLIITDGEPSDEDVLNPNYLRHETKKAIEKARRTGISTYCIGLDPDADQYVPEIFGAKNYLLLDQIKNVPEKLLLLYAELTR
ncbi:MAG: nitric oxide reductase activation protein NorD [Gallionellaceae bacterium]